jgi:hypothetical protein
MKLKTVLLMAVGIFGWTATAQAVAFVNQPPYKVSYDVSLNYAVNYIALVETYSNGSSITNSFSASSGETIITNPFVANNALVSAFLLGVATDLPNDPAGQQHLVVFTNTDWANSAKNIAFGTLFPYSDEATLISDLISLGTGQGKDPNYNDLFMFQSGDGAGGPNGPIAFGVNQSFSAVAFSDGQIIGSGTNFTTPVTAPVPEPATWAMMLLGFGMMGFAMRKRSNVSTTVSYA